jgi:hypothetical protein
VQNFKSVAAKMNEEIPIFSKYKNGQVDFKLNAIASTGGKTEKFYCSYIAVQRSYYHKTSINGSNSCCLFLNGSSKTCPEPGVTP